MRGRYKLNIVLIVIGILIAIKAIGDTSAVIPPPNIDSVKLSTHTGVGAVSENTEGQESVGSSFSEGGGSSGGSSSGGQFQILDFVAVIVTAVFIILAYLAASKSHSKKNNKKP